MKQNMDEDDFIRLPVISAVVWADRWKPEGRNMKTRLHNSMVLTGKWTKTLGAVLVLAFVLLATPALWSSPIIQFSPGTGSSGAGYWEYDGAGTLSLFQDIIVDVGLGSDALVGALVYIPVLSVGGIPAGPYTLTPNGPGTIMIKSPDNTKTYLTGTLGPGNLDPSGTTGLSYTNFQVDITNVTVTDDGRALGSNALDAIDSAQCPLDFELSFQGAPSQGFKAILVNGVAATDGFSGAMTIKCPDCQLEVTKEACVVVPGGDVCFKGNKVKRIILEYTGQGCGASSHSQGADKVKCSGDPSGTEPVDIFVTDKKLNKNWGSAIGILIGGHVLVDAANEGKDNLDSETKVIITNAVGDVIQEVSFHTSCSQPLAVGDQFGSMRLISLTTTEGGTVSSDTCSTELPGLPGPFDVEYTYTITNNGSTDLTDVTVIDDVFGAIPGSPISSILPGETVVLTLIESLGDATTNTVVVTAAEGCQAEATATITKAPPEPPKCTTKVQKMLLEYIGPTVPAPVTVTIKADKFKNDPVTYAISGNLVSGTVLSSPAENNWTIDATAHSQSELGSKTKILINGIEEKIHTSCSTPFVAGEPAPLDRPKGDPSPNWFVVDFVQK